MKTVAQNRRARFDYEILETIEAGIVLTGPEAKSCRLGTVNLMGAYVSFLRNTAILKHMTIARYPFAAESVSTEPGRDRPLLLKIPERDRLLNAISEKGISVIPLEVRAGKHIKILLGIGRGRKTIDKRQRIREREMGRNLREGKEA